MDYAIVQTLNGLVLGIILAVIAVGLTLVFSILKIVNFAHGELYMMGAYFAYYTITLLGIPPFPALLVAIAASFLLGAVRAAKDPADIHRQLTKKRLTHLLVREELLVRFLRDNLSPAELSIWDGFASGHLRGLFHSNGYSVVQIHG